MEELRYAYKNFVIWREEAAWCPKLENILLKWTIQIDLINSFKIPSVSSFPVIIITHISYLLDRASLNKCEKHCELRTLGIFIVNRSIYLNYTLVIKFKCSNQFHVPIVATSRFFLYCWPCILIDPYNTNQLDALFILCLFHQSPLHVSGMLLAIIRRYHCIYRKIGTCYTFSWHSAGRKSDRRIYLSNQMEILQYKVISVNYYVSVFITAWNTR
jgi:hypothetical protein